MTHKGPRGNSGRQRDWAPKHSDTTPETNLFVSPPDAGLVPLHETNHSPCGPLTQHIWSGSSCAQPFGLRPRASRLAAHLQHQPARCTLTTVKGTQKQAPKSPKQQHEGGPLKLKDISASPKRPLTFLSQSFYQATRPAQTSEANDVS